MAFGSAIGFFFFRVLYKGHLIQPFLPKAQLGQEGPAVHSAGSQKSPVLGKSSTSPGRSFQWLTVLFVKKNCPCVQLEHPQE